MKAAIGLVFLFLLALPAQADPVPSILRTAVITSEAMDMYSTAKALRAGAHEANPIMASPIGATAKGAATAINAIVVGRLWTSHHKIAAVLWTAATSSATIAIARHNLAVANGH